MKRAVIYVRQSLAKDGDELAITRQLKECKKLCADRGYTVVQVIEDNNRSASIGVRPGYKQLLKMIEAREIDVVVVLRHDRLLRRLADLEHLIDLSERTGTLIATVSGDLDLTNSTGRLVGRILASVARAEVETKSERHKLANLQKAQSGLPHICRRPYGYESDGITQVPEEVEIMRTWYRMLMSGQGYKHAAWWCNENGYTTTLGKLFYPLTIRNMLTKPRYAGIRHYEGVDYPAVWEPVFSPEEWEALQALIRVKKEKSKTTGPATKYLLTGIAECGKCGLKMNGSIKRDNPKRPLRRTYICRQQGDTGYIHGCGMSRNADALEEWLRQCLIYRLDSPVLDELLASSDSGNLSDLLRKREELRLRKNAVVDDYADGTLDKSAYSRATARLTASLTALEQEIDAQVSPKLGVGLKAGETVAEAWERNDVEWKRQLVTMVMDKIVVNQGLGKPWFPMPDGSRAKFDVSLIEFKWRV